MTLGFTVTTRVLSWVPRFGRVTCGDWWGLFCTWLCMGVELCSHTIPKPVRDADKFKVGSLGRSGT